MGDNINKIMQLLKQLSVPPADLTDESDEILVAELNKCWMMLSNKELNILKVMHKHLTNQLIIL